MDYQLNGVVICENNNVPIRFKSNNSSYVEYPIHFSSFRSLQQGFLILDKSNTCRTGIYRRCSSSSLLHIFKTYVSLSSYVYYTLWLFSCNKYSYDGTKYIEVSLMPVHIYNLCTLQDVVIFKFRLCVGNKFIIRRRNKTFY